MKAATTTREVTELDVDGMVDARGVEFIGKATRVNGEWRCLANVQGCLCVVAVNIRFEVEAKS